jgi:hypothetical protein
MVRWPAGSVLLSIQGVQMKVLGVASLIVLTALFSTAEAPWCLAVIPLAGIVMFFGRKV